MADTYAERLLSEGTTGNSVQGCFIGVNANGTAALANGGYGIGLFAGAAGNRIGGVTPGAGNVIAGNKDYGVLIGGEGTDRNVVQGNLVGTDATGGRALPNGSFGILVYGGARDNTIGGTVAGAGNVISGNRSVGVSLTGSGTDGNVMQGNWIGSDAAGLVAIPNSSAGIQVSGGAKGNVIGGTALRTGNLISGNTGHGVSIVGDGTTGTVVQGNFIGTDITGTTPLANTVNGVDLAAGAQNNTVGGSNSGAGNRIGGNRGSGIFVTGATTLGNALRGNLLFRNGALGINLVGGTQNSAQVTANDAGDADTGPNNLQNYPVITAATIAGGETILTGTLNSTPGATFALDFFASPEAHTSGYGEGAVYLGSATVTADASGNAAFEFRAPGSLVNQFITTTATNGTTGDTSEFSQAKKAS
jgi:titin